MTLHDKAMKAAYKYMMFSDSSAEYLGTVDNFQVYHGEDGYVFVNVLISADGFKSTERFDLKALFEIALAQFFTDNPDVSIDEPIQCDEISLHVVGDNRALLRHLHNALNL